MTRRARPERRDAESPGRLALQQVGEHPQQRRRAELGDLGRPPQEVGRPSVGGQQRRQGLGRALPPGNLFGRQALRVF
ncbi:hypothetical protein MKK63_00490 [Methylobacterium sp. J-088]|uniref:hypothetical protein n=1 Tax=Methylobacterium sp. J-088 TaxID=2836664 RepID=UPI001FB8644E|nr:hypothetical protein [Methylobacterium sp. J-088]MCJ2061199.1 hypothetical protein [Methylobacterium sp. J-088]